MVAAVILYGVNHFDSQSIVELMCWLNDEEVLEVARVGGSSACRGTFASKTRLKNPTIISSQFC